MNGSRLIVQAAAVFAAQAVVAGALQMSVVDRLFDDPELFRPEGEEHLLPYFASRVLFVVLFTYLFARIFPRSGVTGGLKFAVLIWLFYSVPMTVGCWAFLRMPDGLALAWTGVGLAEMLTGGAVLGMLNRPAKGDDAGSLPARATGATV